MNEIVIRAKYIPPKGTGDPKVRDYYQGNDGYLKYISSKPMGIIAMPNSKTGYSSYFDYMGHRDGSSGYWSNNANNKIKPIDDESMIWDMVVSWDREFAIENGVVSEESSKPIIQKTINNFLIRNGIDKDKVQYVVSHHSNTDNPHVHIRINETVPSRRVKRDGKTTYEHHPGKLKMSAIVGWKKDLKISSERKGAITWAIPAAQRQLARNVIQETIKENWVQLGMMAQEIQSAIKNKKNNQRISYASMDDQLKNKVDVAFESFKNIYPEVGREVGKLEDWYEEQGFSSSHKDSIFQQRLDEAQRSLKNQFIKSIIKVDVGNTTVPSKTSTSFKRRRNIVVKNIKRKVNKNELDKLVRATGNLMRDIEQEVIDLGRKV